MEVEAVKENIYFYLEALRKSSPKTKMKAAGVPSIVIRIIKTVVFTLHLHQDIKLLYN